MNKTMQSQSFKTAIHLSKCIPLGAKTPEKKEAVRRWCDAVKFMLANNK
jgi:hypothetical protein